MEKQFRAQGDIEFIRLAPDGQTGALEWLEKYLNEGILEGPAQVMTTFMGCEINKKICEWEAAFVFKPVKARGPQGVMLIECFGICEMREFFFNQESGLLSKDDFALYPLGVPVSEDHFQIHNQLSAMMIGKVWRKFALVKSPDLKWTQLATFNVMQHLFYQISQKYMDNPEDIGKGIEYLKYLNRFFSQICPMLLKADKEFKKKVHA